MISKVPVAKLDRGRLQDYKLNHHLTTTGVSNLNQPQQNTGSLALDFFTNGRHDTLPKAWPCSCPNFIFGQLFSAASSMLCLPLLYRLHFYFSPLLSVFILWCFVKDVQMNNYWCQQSIIFLYILCWHNKKYSWQQVAKLGSLHFISPAFRINTSFCNEQSIVNHYGCKSSYWWWVQTRKE